MTLNKNTIQINWCLAITNELTQQEKAIFCFNRYSMTTESGCNMAKPAENVGFAGAVFSI